MKLKKIIEWKKVYELDLKYVVDEFKDTVETPCVVVLEGPVGAGKTYFTKKFWPRDTVVSPTYSIIQEDQNFVHADLYRLEVPDDLEHLELNLYLEDKDYIFIEWGKKYIDHLQREISGEFKFYLLEISINPEASQDVDNKSSRNYKLCQVE